MTRQCRYCDTELPASGYGKRRVICGSTLCKRAYNRDYAANARAKPGYVNKVYPDEATTIAHRTWGDLTIPDDQSTLNKGMDGQFVFCPNCGAEHLVTMEQRLECIKCKSVWTISWGTRPNGDVVVARVDRWR